MIKFEVELMDEEDIEIFIRATELLAIFFRRVA